MLEVNDDLNKGLFKNSPFKYKGEKYYYMDGNIVDSSFITPSDSLVTEITNLLYKLFDYKLYPTAVQKNIIYITLQLLQLSIY